MMHLAIRKDHVQSIPYLEVRESSRKVGPVLDVKICDHQGRCGVETMIESLYRDRTVSWVVS